MIEKRIAAMVGAILLTPVGGMGQAPTVEPKPAPPIVSWQDAPAYMDREVIVVGKIVRTNRTQNLRFLNFADDYRGTLSLVIRGDNVAKFPGPPEEIYKGKFVKVHGWVSEYRGQPQVLVGKPSQIEILPDGAPLPETAGPPPPERVVPLAASGEITIASFNVENLYDAEDDPYSNDESTPTKSVADREKLAKVIHSLNADVLAVVEVENRGVLQDFNRRYLADLGYRHVVLFEGNDLRGIDVGLLSRVPVGRVTSHRHVAFKTPKGKPERFHRDLLQVRLEPPGAPPFDVLVVHFKSKEGGDDEALDVREGEALTARAVCDEMLKANADARFVVCGDFNDTIDSEPMQMILGKGAGALRSFHDDVPADDRITYNRDPYRSMIDFILCSPAMAKLYVAKSLRIPQGTAESNGSDHNPVVARFKIK